MAAERHWGENVMGARVQECYDDHDDCDEGDDELEVDEDCEDCTLCPCCRGVDEENDDEGRQSQDEEVGTSMKLLGNKKEGEEREGSPADRNENLP